MRAREVTHGEREWTTGLTPSVSRPTPGPDPAVRARRRLMALFEVELVEQACLLRCVVGLLTLGPSTTWQVSLLRDLALGAGHIAESALELDLTEVAAIAEGLRDAAVALRTAAESSVLDTRSASALTAAIEAMPPAFRALDEGRRLPPAACDLHLERLATLAAGARL